MWVAASTTALWTQLTGDVSAIFYTVIAAVLTVLAGMLGLGFGVRKVRKYVTGRKF